MGNMRLLIILALSVRIWAYNKAKNENYVKVKNKCSKIC